MFIIFVSVEVAKHKASWDMESRKHRPGEALFVGCIWILLSKCRLRTLSQRPLEELQLVWVLQQFKDCFSQEASLNPPQAVSLVSPVAALVNCTPATHCCGATVVRSGTVTASLAPLCRRGTLRKVRSCPQWVFL